MNYLALLPFFIVALGGLLVLLLVRDPVRIGAARGAERQLVAAGDPAPARAALGPAAAVAGPTEGSANHPVIVWTTLAILAAAIGTAIWQWLGDGSVAAGLSGGTIAFRQEFFHHLLAADWFSAFFTILVLVAGLVTVITLQPYAGQERMNHGELYALLLFAISGMVVLASGIDLIVLFLGLEIMSLAVYALVGMRRFDLLANEGALKYVLLGAFSSAIFLFGVAFCYGATGTTRLAGISASAPGGAQHLYLLVGLMLLLAGLAFKVASFPFHMWAPDVYQGAAAPITGFMATAVKAASFALFLRILFAGFSSLSVSWTGVLWWFAVLTMFVGNFTALRQTNIKRMLAYSSIAHTGYLLIGLAAAFGPHHGGVAAILYYLAAYALTNLGAFACVAYLSGPGEQRITLDSWAGIGRRHPVIATAMVVCMLSLIGFPPTAGFFGKYLLFSAAMRAGQTPLAFIGIFNSILSIWYYLRVVVVMTMRAPEGQPVAAQPRWGAGLAAGYAALAVVWAGIGPLTLIAIFPGAQSLVSWAHTAITTLF